MYYIYAIRRLVKQNDSAAGCIYYTENTPLSFRTSV